MLQRSFLIRYGLARQFCAQSERNTKQPAMKMRQKRWTKVILKITDNRYQTVMPRRLLVNDRAIQIFRAAIAGVSIGKQAVDVAASHLKLPYSIRSGISGRQSLELPASCNDGQGAMCLLSMQELPTGIIKTEDAQIRGAGIQRGEASFLIIEEQMGG